MPENIPVCLQMYTVREDAGRDFAGTVEIVAKIGYIGVEFAGYGSAGSAAAAKQILDDNGLFVCSTHVGLDLLEGDIDSVIEDCQTLGCDYVVVPYLADNRRGSLDAHRLLGATLTELGAKLQSADLQLCYHNHDFEFKKFGGEDYGLDVLFASADPKLVKVELDTFWVKKAGEDPAAYIRKYSGRIPLLHLKDMTTEGKFAEVGEGVIDYPSIFEAAGTAGSLFYIVEQDQCYNHPPLESVRISFENLKKLGVIS